MAEKSISETAEKESPGTLGFNIGPISCMCMKMGNVHEGNEFYEVLDRNGRMKLASVPAPQLRPKFIEDNPAAEIPSMLAFPNSETDEAILPSQFEIRTSSTSTSPYIDEPGDSRSSSSRDAQVSGCNGDVYSGNLHPRFNSGTLSKGILAQRSIDEYEAQYGETRGLFMLPQLRFLPGVTGLVHHKSLFHPLVPALLRGRAIEAYRAVQIMEQGGANPTDFMNPRAYDRLQRLGQRWTESLEELKPVINHDWIIDKDEGSCTDIKVHVVDGVLHLLCTSTHYDVDILHAYVALCEVDLSTHYFNDVKKVYPVGEQRTDESLWRLVRKYPRHDNIVEVHCADALDDASLGSLWVSRREVPSSASEVHGVVFPCCTKGYTRVSQECLTFQVKPMTSLHHVQVHPRPFRLTMAKRVKLSSSMISMYRVFPRMVQKTHYCQEARRFVDRFNHLLRGGNMHKVIEGSPRKNFYKQVQKHLIGVEHD